MLLISCLPDSAGIQTALNLEMLRAECFWVHGRRADWGMAPAHCSVNIYGNPLLPGGMGEPGNHSEEDAVGAFTVL